MVGGVGAGLWKDLNEACGNLKIETTTLPNAENKGVYDDLYGIYQDMVPALKRNFDRLSAK
jgi:xylulokinase